MALSAEQDTAEPRTVLLVVENNSLPSDPRAWWECRTLATAGYRVIGIGPTGSGRDDELFEMRDGIEIHRFPVHSTSPGMAGHLHEYSSAAWHISRLIRQVSRGRRVDVVHACNPPDFLLALAGPLKARGARFVFDHHDAVPEMFSAIYGDRARTVRRATMLTERLAYALSDVVLATNESYRRIALKRGRKREEDVLVVRNAPDAEVFAPRPPDPALRQRAPHILSYVGMMGHQDGVDEGVRILARLAARRRDWLAVLVGDGPARAGARQLAEDLGLNGLVEFAGWMGSQDVIRILATSDICLSPEPLTRYNEISTLIKVGEYMAMAKPIVCYELPESLVTAGPSAWPIGPGDQQAFALAISALLDDPYRRSEMGAAGRTRITGELSREHSRAALLEAYERVHR